MTNLSLTISSANPTTDSNLRYAAYTTRIRTILLSAQRYVAYTSDIGESFRPIAHPWLVKGAYGVSWAYIVGDVGFEGYKAYLRNQRIIHPGVPGITSARAVDARDASTGSDNRPQLGRVPALEDYRSVMAQRALFQSIASMGLPAFTIHSIVRYSGRALKDAKNMKIRTYGPIGVCEPGCVLFMSLLILVCQLGLVAVPFLPFVFDKPVEHAVEWTFHRAFETFGGPEAVGNRPKTGRGEDLQDSSKILAKEKEL